MPKRVLAVVLVIVCAFLVYAVFPYSYHGMDATPYLQSAKMNVLERVMKTKKLRCAYWTWAEFIERDPNTGVMKGASVGISNKVADALGAKIEWVQEASMDDFVALLDSDKVDAICGSFAPAPFLRPQASFSTPIFYVDVDVYVRNGEKRFANDKKELDTSGVRLLSLDGSAARYFANNFFPKAQQSSLPSVAGTGQVFMDISHNKADATVSDQLTAARFIENNPNSIMMQRWETPLITLSSTPFITKKDDVVWAHTLDGIIRDLLDFGDIDRILLEHHLVAGHHYRRIAQPYR